MKISTGNTTCFETAYLKVLIFKHTWPKWTETLTKGIYDPNELNGTVFKPIDI